MKKLMAAAAFCAALLALGCSDDSPTQPAPPSEFELRATAVIGPDGGQVGTAEFVLTVPSGAFDSDYLLSVYSTSGPTVLPAITRRFRLEGLPPLYSKPLSAVILQRDSLQVNKVMSVGHHAWVPAAADTELLSRTYPVTDSLYRLVVALPATRIVSASTRHGMDLLSADGDLTGLTFEGRSGYLVLNSANFDGGLPAAAVEILTADCLEATLDSLAALGFDYAADGLPPLSPRINTGVEADWRADVPCYAYLPQVGERRALMLRFDQDKLSIGSQWCDRPVQPRVARALCDLYAQVYDANYAANARLWLHKAVGLWAEYHYAANPNYLPPDFVGHARAVFDGMVWGAEGQRAEILGHGYGMAPMISYLVDRAEAGGDHTLLADIYNRILNHNDPVASLLVEAPAPVNEWWPDFLAKYIEGSVWPIYNVGGIAYDGHGIFYAGGDTTLTFTGGMRDLSARLYRIGLDRPGLGPTAQVRFRLNAQNLSDDQVSIVIFRNMNGVFEELARGHSITIKNVASLNDNGYELYALVTDSRHDFPYTGLASVTLTATLAEPVDLSLITLGGVKVGGMRVTWGYSPDTCGTPPASSIGMWLYSGRPGRFVGNTFTSVWSDTTTGIDGNVARNGTMTITVTEDQTAASFEVNETIEDFDSGCTTEVHITGFSIPSYPPEYGRLEYRASDSKAAAKLTIQSRRTCAGSGCEVIVKSLSYSPRAGVVIDLF